MNPGTTTADAAADKVRQSTAYHVLVTVGLISFGLVHLVLAWLAVQVAVTGGGGASQQGAMRQLSQQPLGKVLLWVMAVGLAALVIWQIAEATVVLDGQTSAKQIRRRLSSIGRAIVYLGLSISAAKFALGSGTSNGKTQETVSAKLMAVPFGRVLVAIVGAIVIAVAVSQVVKGVKRKFVDDLGGGVHEGALKLGTVGYCAKGVALAIIGLLFGWAAITYDPKKAGGMDAALATLRSQPFGAVLLFVMALGIASFAVYCFYWARTPRY